MNILRRASTTRLLIGIGLVVAVAVAAGIALAGRSGPVPPKRSLAAAIHHSLAGPRPTGVSARIRFWNHLFASGALPQGDQPLLAGASGRLWAGGGRVRLELQSSNGDTEIGFDGRTVIVYDVSSNTAYEMRVPQRHHAESGDHAHHVPSLAEIQRGLARIAEHATLSGAIPGDTAGQPSYTVRISPQHDAGLLGAVELAFDADRAVPLKLAVYSQGDSSPVLALSVTDISFGPVSSSDTAVTPAASAKIVRVHPPAPDRLRGSGHGAAAVTGVQAVSHALPFPLSAPRTLVGVPRQAVRLVDGAGSPGAMIVYGRGLGAIVLLEQPVSGRDAGPLGSLPAVSIDGASGHELATALGTVIQFDRGGVRYTLAGSLPSAAAEAAARAIG